MVRHLHRPTIRFFEADQQRVVYHMWYFAYFEDARNDMLERNGLSLRSLLESGYDLQVVHFELDLLGAVRWEDELVIAVDVDRVGTTSFTLRYEALVNGLRQVTGRVVYVVVSRGEGHKTPVPEELRRVLG
ncbi:MAG TPA: thioesterase family protein [Mycobacteriales bacterium]|jgi:Predicted thioesterase